MSENRLPLSDTELDALIARRRGAPFGIEARTANELANITDLLAELIRESRALRSQIPQ